MVVKRCGWMIAALTAVGLAGCATTHGNLESSAPESFATGLLDWPHYTRPEVYRELRVPDVLLSGHHARVESWRIEQALLLTYARRPDLLSE